MSDARKFAPRACELITIITILGYRLSTQVRSMITYASEATVTLFRNLCFEVILW
jgi:hypothetical protein